MKENNNTIMAFQINGQPLPKPRMTSRSKFFDKHYKKYWEYLNSASEIIWAEMKKNKWKTIQEDVVCDTIYYRKDKRRADCDNLQKTAYEILAKAEVIQNDKQIVEGHFKVVYGCDEPRTDIKVMKL